MTPRRAVAALMSALVAAAGFPGAAVAQVARVGELAARPVLGAAAAPAPVTISAPSLAAPLALTAPALSPLSAPSIAPAPALAAAPPLAPAAVPAAAPALAAPAVLPAAAAPSDGKPAKAAETPAEAPAAAPSAEQDKSGAAELFDGAKPAAGGDWDVPTREDLPGYRMTGRSRQLFGVRRSEAGPVARALGFAARITGVAALWGLYRDGVLVQRYAGRLADQSLPVLRRASAARTLASLGRVDAVPLLAQAAENDPNTRVRLSARAALVFLANSAAPGLARSLRRSPFPVTRENAAVALGWLVGATDSPEVLDVLGSAALMDRSEGVRMAAVNALAGARSPKALAILSWMKGVERRPAAVAAIERARLAATERHAAAGRMHLVPPAEDLPLAASPLHAAALKSSIVVGLTFAVVEFAGGLFTGTLALRADALHLAGDRLLDAAALLAMSIARRPPTSRKTYGWLKAEAVFAFAGALGIAAMGLSMVPGVYEAFVHPAAASGWSVIGFAALSIVSNLISASMLHRHRAEHMGVRGAFLHAMTDAVGTFGVMLAAAASLVFRWTWLLPLATAAMVAMVLRVAWELGRPAWDVLLDSVPRGLDMDKLESDLAAVPGVASVVDLHVRALNSQGAELTAKLYVQPGADRDAVLASASAFLRERYGIVHATIQLEARPAARQQTGTKP